MPAEVIVRMVSATLTSTGFGVRWTRVVPLGVVLPATLQSTSPFFLREMSLTGYICPKVVRKSLSTIYVIVAAVVVII